ncbi:hypothetical protein BDP55DRAFT_771132 [Colletotrichum godetiae]|uniref:Uncharacterized protein n=1 Tax=Colletotrichum godetiae TaxID=1209918 RepID=A0AAJ0ADY8_9PEZI|nr:uncharacterized protein BDP55DRAFT_771132 [Colletotrichum godetiae]KAK1672153.1 hypothetical protein BDP55DRAFT_771132 [Colletotrichum godetiae]
MHSPSLRSMRGNPNASPEEHLDRIELSPRRPETPIEEQCGYSFQEIRKMSANDEYRAFLAPSMLDFSDQQSLHLNSVPEVSSPDSEQELSKHMTSNDIANQRHPSTPPDSGLTIEWIWSVWWVEMFSSVLALECISAIMIILSIYRGQPLPHWPKLISINSLIAVFTAVFKAALILPVAEGLGQLKWNWFDRSQTLGDLVLFDNASRGPWGSLLLMKSYILRPSIRGYLAGLGAFITVAALAIDAFSQATISLGSCNITADSGLAQVPRTNNYSGNPQRRDSSLDAAPITLNQKMRKAINKGLVDPPKAGELIKFDCTSRNCTFTQDGGGGYFSSLGICYSCDDITDQAVLKFFTKKSAPAVNISMWSLPWSKNTSETILQRENGGTLLTMRPTPIQTYHNNSPPIFSFDILSLTYSKCDSCGPGVPSVARKPFAAQCRIDPCVRKYNATVTDGVYTEKVEGHGQLLKRRRATLGESKNENAFALLTESVLVDGTERKCKEVEERAINSVRVGLRQDGHFQEIFDNSSEISHSENLFWKTYPQECVWVVDRNSWQGMRETMTELLSGRVMTPEADSFQWLNGSVWGQQLFAAGNASISTVNNLVAGLAESMTATIRNDPYGTSEELGKNVPADLKVATGRVIITQTCIYVQWGYIAYPIALLALQWIFSTLVLIACSQRRRTRDGPARAVWKSSPLALLFHGLDEDLRVRSQNLETFRQMNSLADDVKVRLVPMKDSQRKGWHFAGA